MSSADDNIPAPGAVEPVVPALEEPLAAGNGHAAPIDERRIRQVPAFHHNWSDLLFIMDVMEDNAVEPCDILIFISKSDDLISVLEDKKVDTQQSRLDVSTGTVNLVYTEAGIIERLLGMKILSGGTSGGIIDNMIVESQVQS